MNLPLFFILISLIALACLWMGKKASRSVETSDDYFLGGRGIGLIPLTLTFLATQLGGGTLLGAAQEAFNRGWIVLLYPLGTCLGFIALGTGFGGRLRELRLSTIAEVFEKIYLCRKQRHVASILSIVTLFLILIAQAIAARTFFALLGITSPTFFLLFWSALIGYTVMGGLKAVVKTDMLQALFILLAIGTVLFSADLSLPPLSSIESAPSLKGTIPWSSWLLMPLLFMLIEQDMGQRCFAAKNRKVVSLAALFASGLLLFSSSSAIFLGIAAKKWGLEPSSGASILVDVVTFLTNPTVTTLFMVAIFLAVLSTADSLLCSISSNIGCDLLGSLKITSKQRVRLSQLCTLAIGLATALLAYLFDQVVPVLILSYELSVSLLCVPVVAAILTKSPSRRGSWFAMGCGAIGFILFRYLPLPLPRELLTLALSTSGYLIGQKMEKRVVA